MLKLLFSLAMIGAINAIIAAVEKRNDIKRKKLSDNPEEILEVARYYDSRQKFKDAFVWYEKAAEKELPEALYELALCYDFSKGCEQNQDKAFQLCLKSAQKGFKDAIYRMGYYYENGRGTTQDYGQALFWYNEAKKKGNKMADHSIEKIKAKLPE